jgi:hypothetical protein
MSETKPKKISAITSNEYRQIYANNLSLRTTNWDLLFDFGKITSVSEDDVSVEKLVGIVVSPQQAKEISFQLTGAVSEFEKQFGEISTK